MNKIIELPTPADIEAAYLHARWLRTQTVSGESRMLADLSYEVQRLRAELDDAIAAHEKRLDEIALEQGKLCMD